MEKYVKDRPDINAQAMDIEDLARLGGTLGGPCPYFLTRTLASTSELIFMPYNYLVDPATRSGLKIDWSGCIMIFDEAHNVTVRLPRPPFHSPSPNRTFFGQCQVALGGDRAAMRRRAGLQTVTSNHILWCKAGGRGVRCGGTDLQESCPGGGLIQPVGS